MMYNMRRIKEGKDAHMGGMEVVQEQGNSGKLTMDDLKDNYLSFCQVCNSIVLLFVDIDYFLKLEIYHTDNNYIYISSLFIMTESNSSVSSKSISTSEERRRDGEMKRNYSRRNTESRTKSKRET